MTTFWVIIAFLVAAALAFVLPPLLRRTAKGGVAREDVNVTIYQDQFAELDADLRNGVLGQEQHEQGRRELQQRLLEDVPATAAATAGASAGGGRGVAVLVGVAVPVLAVLLYLQIGNPKAFSPVQEDVQVAGAETHAGGQMTPEQIEAMVAKLAARMEKNPGDAQGWVMLGRSYAVMGRFADASVAYSKATTLTPNDAQLWADYADLTAMAAGKRLAGKPVELINKALAADPTNQKALALAGSAAFEMGNYSGAVAYWKKLLQLVPPDSQEARGISGGIAEAQTLASGGRPPAGPMAAAQSSDNAAQAAPGGGSVAGVVTLSASLAGKASPTDTLFIFARAANGPKMPLAMMRVQVKDLPVSFALDDTMAVMPAMKLSNFQEVVVAAKISKSGSANPQSGDLQGVSNAVKLGASGVKVVIDQIAP
jgi:cytochrome c-type biogenesis protein CcmH